MLDHPFSLVGKHILITGASSGIGYTTAVTCARMGATIIGTGRNSDRLNSLQKALSHIGDSRHMTFQADLTQEQDRETLIQSLGRPINGVVHSAGISRLSPVRMITQQHLQEVQAINVDAPTLLTQALLKKQLISADGSIVFIASIAAHIGVPGVAAYSGSKAALIAIMRCLAMEVVKRGIRVNCLSPALVETPLLDATASMVGSMDAERNNYPLGFGSPEDVANAAVFFLSHASRWITGTTLILDGGLTVR